MLRSSVCRRSLQSFRARAVSTSVPPKQSIPTPPQKPNGGGGGGGGGGVTFVILATLGGIGYAAYQAEVDPAFDAQTKKVPGADVVLNPFRRAIQLTGLVTAPGKSAKESVKESKKAAVTVHTPETTTPKPVDPYAEINKAVVAEINGTNGEQQTDKTPTPVTAEEEAQQIQNSHDNSDQEAVLDDDVASASSQPEPESTTGVAEKSAEEAAAPASAAPAPAEAAKPAGVKLFGIPPEEAARLTESKVLKQALADSAREFIALRRDVEATLLKDIHSLNEHDLRIRIKQLATEMFERLAWEDVRMTQSLKGVQADLTEKYTDLMRRQQKELELEVNKIIFALEQETALKSANQVKQMEATYQKQLEDTVRAQAEGFHATLKRELEEQSNKITTELQDQLNHEVALLRKSQVDELLALQPQVQELHAQLEAVKHAADATAGVIKKTIDIHHLSAAVLSLELALSTPPTAASGGSQSIEKHLGAVRTACQGDAVVSAVLDSLPRRVATSGALSLSDLQVRFGVMREEARKAALAPEAAPKMIGQLIGTALAAISIAPTGLVSGNGVEETLARAAYYLERGRLVDTLRELDGVQGYAQVLMQDWKELARERLIVDQSIRVLKANAVIRHKAFK